MKKKLFKVIGSLLLTAYLFSACQKTTKELTSSDNLLENVAAVNKDNSKCLLSQIDFGDGYQFDFSYNSKNLANMWRITYAPGDYQEHQIEYNIKGRIKSTQVIDPIVLPGDAINYTFYDNGGQTTRVLGYLESGGIWADIYYSYNQKGKLTALDDVVNDYHSRFYYNSQGYNYQTDFYFGTELVYQYLFEFHIPNKNPYLAINGVEFGFPFYVLPTFDKRWESKGTIIYYEEGMPYVIYELDPAQTIMQTGPHNYMTYSSYYDMATETGGSVACTYQNCGGNSEAKAPVPLAKRSIGQLSIKNQLAKILSRPSKKIKQQLHELKEQYFGQPKK